MKRRSIKSTIAVRVVTSHAVGLWVSGMLGTIESTAGFSVGGGWFGLFIGGLFSLPWMVILAIMIWHYSGWIERHPILFALIGPIAVCASYAVLASAFLFETATSCVVASMCFIILTMLNDYLSSKAEKDLI
jgi:hypothetical protein